MTGARPGPEAATPPPTRSFEEMLADPHEQFDGRSELLASIAAYAAAPPASAGIQPPEAAALVPGIAATIPSAITEEIGRLRAERDRLAAENEQLRDGLEQSRVYAQSLAEDLDDAAGHIEAWKREAQSMQRERDEARAENARLAGELAEVRERLRAWKLSAAGDESELQHIHETLENAYGREDLSEETATVVEAMAAEWKRWKAALERIRDDSHAHGHPWHAETARAGLDGTR